MFKVDVQEPPARYFEDFHQGQLMPPVTKGPLTAGHQVRWAGACDNYASEFHHDAAVARAQGLPGLLLSGPFLASYMLTEITHWLGCAARVVSFSNRNTAPTQPGDTGVIHAQVLRAWIQAGQGCVQIDCQILNQDGKLTTPGTLVAQLPLRASTSPKGNHRG